MSNGGQLQPWQRAHQVCVRMLGSNSGIFVGTNQAANNITVDIGRPMEYLQEVWLTEYQIRNNGTAAARNMWRVDLSRSGWECEQSSNSSGQGFCIAVPDMTNTTHVIYDTPRVMSIQGRQGASSLHVRVVDEFGAAVTFHDITLWLVLVYVHPRFSLADARLAEDSLIEWWRSNENVGRFRDRVTNRFI